MGNASVSAAALRGGASEISSAGFQKHSPVIVVLGNEIGAKVPLHIRLTERKWLDQRESVGTSNSPIKRTLPVHGDLDLTIVDAVGLDQNPASVQSAVHDADGMIILSSITASKEKVAAEVKQLADRWRKAREISSTDSRKPPVVLAINRIDIDKADWMITDESLAEIAKGQNIHYCMISIKSDQGVYEMVLQLYDLIAEYWKNES